MKQAGKHVMFKMVAGAGPATIARFSSGGPGRSDHVTEHICGNVEIDEYTADIRNGGEQWRTRSGRIHAQPAQQKRQNHSHQAAEQDRADQACGHHQGDLWPGPENTNQGSSHPHDQPQEPGNKDLLAK